MDKSRKSRPIDPILSLPVQSAATSICFVSRKDSSISFAERDQPTKLHSDKLRHRTESIDGPDSRSQSSGKDYSDANDCDDDDDDNDDDDEIEFRSSTIRVEGPESASFHNKYSRRLLSDRFLASCHRNGEALIWDLENQKQVATISPPRGGSGICIRRTDDPSQIMFQTRDPKGTVSLHSIERCDDTGGQENGSSISSVRTKSTANRQYETYSKTFCQAAPCHGNKHLLALPNIDHSTVTVVDERTDANVANYCIDKHGMVTSLALSDTDNYAGHDNGRPILACGMESGTTLFFDITDGSKKSFHESSFSIGKDPILTLDLLPSSCALKSSDASLPVERRSRALLVAAGMAGDAQDVSELSEDEAGRAVIFKTVYSHDDCNNYSWNFKQQARLSTCRVDRESYSGKPGISICRFRPKDGRLLAIGGWDKRIRLFERSKGNMVAILKGSTGSIADLDWAPDSVTSGLLASADKNDKLITLWQCFAN
jgi:hypothetical protein